MTLGTLGISGAIQCIHALAAAFDPDADQSALAASLAAPGLHERIAADRIRKPRETIARWRDQGKRSRSHERS